MHAHGAEQWIAWARARLHHHRRVVAAGCVLLAVVAVWAWWVSPGRRLRQFVAAANRGDYTALLSLVSPAEIKGLEVTPEKLKAMMGMCLAWAPPGTKLVANRGIGYGGIQRRYNRALVVGLQASDGKRLAGADGDTAECWVVAYRTKKGWKVGLSRFLSELSRTAKGRARVRGPRYDVICARAGVRIRLYLPENGTWASYDPRLGVFSTRPAR